VDDEAALRHAVSEILRQSGYTVEATGSADALELARSHSGRKPHPSHRHRHARNAGTDLAPKVRDLRPDIKVIYLSALPKAFPNLKFPTALNASKNLSVSPPRFALRQTSSPPHFSAPSALPFLSSSVFL